jgi:Flp pilus assembly protein TadB
VNARRGVERRNADSSGSIVHTGEKRDFVHRRKKEVQMINLLLIIGIVLVVLWLLGIVTSTTLGGFVYVALVIGIILVVIWLVTRSRGRR